MKIGVLITGRPPDVLQDQFDDYDSFFARLLQGHGFGFQGWPVLDGDFPKHVTEADGWLITGSKYGAYEDHDWIPPLEDFIREIYASGRPLVGICFGHQVMAQALGGKVEKFSGGWSVGGTDYRLASGGTMRLNAWHQDQVTTAPPGTTTIAETDFCKHAGLAYRDNTISLQPHPEFNDDYIEALLDTRGSTLPAEIRDGARAGLDAVLHTSEAALMIAAALKAGPTAKT